MSLPDTFVVASASSSEDTIFSFSSQLENKLCVRGYRGYGQLRTKGNNNEVMLPPRHEEYPGKHVGWLFFGILSLSMGRLPQREKTEGEGGRKNLYFIYYLNKQFCAASICAWFYNNMSPFPHHSLISILFRTLYTVWLVGIGTVQSVLICMHLYCVSSSLIGFHPSNPTENKVTCWKGLRWESG